MSCGRKLVCALWFRPEEGSEKFDRKLDFVCKLHFSTPNFGAHGHFEYGDVAHFWISVPLLW
jgi:hypothetical protein